MTSARKQRQGKAAQEFKNMLHGMLDLVATGRGIELLLRLADQVQEAADVTRRSYESFMQSPLRVPSLHPPQALPRLFSNQADRDHVELAREIADKLAHGLYRDARLRIDKYSRTYALAAVLTSNPVRGWHIEASGHLIDTDGRHIDRIEDWMTSSPDNLMFEEYEVFVANGYASAAREIFNAAWQRIASVKPALATDIQHLQRFRSFKRGKRYYSNEPKSPPPSAA